MRQSIPILVLCILTLSIASCDQTTTITGEKPSSGSLKVSTETTGQDIDEDGYTLQFADQEVSLAANDSKMIENLTPKNYQLDLSQVASNCTIASEPSELKVEVVAGETVTVSIGVTCDKQAEDKVVISKEPDGTQTNQIYLMDSDGSNIQKLTDTDSNTRDLWPVFSNDGTKIAFVREINNGTNDFSRNLYIMDVDGKNLHQVTSSGRVVLAPSWSPDDSTLAYSEHTSSDRISSVSPGLEIYKIKIDGSAKTQLTDNDVLDRSPSWSPDGKKILYHSLRDGGNDLNLMNPDGSQKEKLTNTSLTYVGARWSPNGDKIAFLGYGNDSESYIYTIDADGNNQQMVSTGIEQESFFKSGPTWSPDGSELMYSSKGNENVPENILKTSSESVQVRLVTESDYSEEQMPNWSPISKE